MDCYKMWATLSKRRRVYLVLFAILLNGQALLADVRFGGITYWDYWTTLASEYGGNIRRVNPGYWYDEWSGAHGKAAQVAYRQHLESRYEAGMDRYGTSPGTTALVDVFSGTPHAAIYGTDAMTGSRVSGSDRLMAIGATTLSVLPAAKLASAKTGINPAIWREGSRIRYSSRAVYQQASLTLGDGSVIDASYYRSPSVISSIPPQAAISGMTVTQPKRLGMQPVTFAANERALARAYYSKNGGRQNLPPNVTVLGEVSCGVTNHELTQLQDMANELGFPIAADGSRVRTYAYWRNNTWGPWSGRSTSDIDLKTIEGDFSNMNKLANWLDDIEGDPNRPGVPGFRNQFPFLEHGPIGRFDSIEEAIKSDAIVIIPQRAK